MDTTPAPVQVEGKDGDVAALGSYPLLEYVLNKITSSIAGGH